ncbi:MAG: hypothetical protein FWD11_03510, partial [Micrococcales bacterium]|nr:hypothetical protein [Micrococcales bacterium]
SPVTAATPHEAMPASVVSSSPTGTTVDGKTEISVALKVNRPDGTVFDARTTKLVAPTMVQYLAPGRIVQVVPDDGDNLSIIVPATQSVTL